ncbi:inactive tyrosine-protein kinase transmembrane receptor ROR1-like [Montipora foliosa]|uniref:inactive tyrosine-protein kinase transmembrane receptor ROR1-like n=1 Tax=Montipora foliosa TaxID=591990 RepID=UPI0035F10C76
MCPVNKEEYLSRRIPLIAYMFATLILEVFATNETSVNMNNSSRCIQAVPAVSEFARNNSCIFYKYTLDGFCKDIITSLYVFGDQRTIAHGENQINALQFYYRFLTIGQKCAPLLIDLYCRYHFPPCDTTLEKPRKRGICRRSCNHVLDVLCAREMDLVRQEAITLPGFDHDMINCSTYPVASGGEGPECYQFSSLPDDDTRSTDCYHGIGVGYRGNVNVTRSGRTCQRWIAQCPHRHWRIPEDVDKSQNDSNNMCRNPDGSAPDGPWCYTTDPNKRWEYCNISQCPLRVPRKIPALPDGFPLNAMTIYLSWEAIPTSLPSGKEPLLGYRVRYQRLGSALYSQVYVSSDVTEISLTNLTPQTKYKIEVNGFNFIGHGEASTAIIIKTFQPGHRLGNTAY